MEAATPPIFEIYQEATPNPESLKFITNLHLLPNWYVEYKNKEQAEESELAQMLFDLPFIQAVFISNNFLTLTKKAEYEWYEITPEIKHEIRKFIASGRKVVSDSVLAKGNAPTTQSSDETSSPEEKIKELLEKYVRPAVETDGGVIEFRSFENGIVSLVLKGSCSGCPSASLTLKGGVEGLLKRMVPEVQEVVSYEE